MNSARQYDTLSDDYHWLYSDYVLSGKMATEEIADLLTLTGANADILDCSCGIGTLAIALAKLGYRVSGSDGSQGMIDQATLAARNSNVNMPLKCCTWADLPDHFTDRFDLVFCMGNSIGHLRNSDEMSRSLRGMRQVLRDRGKLVIESRNWEQIRKEKTRFTLFQWRERAGQRCLPVYVWSFPENFHEAHTIEVLLVFETGGKASIRSYPIVYYPFHQEELTEQLRCAGFSDSQVRFNMGQTAYRVIAS